MVTKVSARSAVSTEKCHGIAGVPRWGTSQRRPRVRRVGRSPATSCGTARSSFLSRRLGRYTAELVRNMTFKAPIASDPPARPTDRSHSPAEHGGTHLQRPRAYHFPAAPDGTAATTTPSPNHRHILDHNTPEDPAARPVTPTPLTSHQLSSTPAEAQPQVRRIVPPTRPLHLTH
jgi:hypothetical protein